MRPVLMLWFLSCCGKYCISSVECQKTPFTIDDLINPSASMDNTDCTWLTGDKLAYEKDDKIYIVNIGENSTSKTVLLDEDISMRYQHLFWSISPTTTFIALTTDKKELTRHRILQKITLLNTKTLNSTAVKATNDWVLVLVWNKGSGSDDFVFVADNDIYYQNANTALPPVRVTFTGATLIYNGVPDWMYEEEIIQTNTALWWSPDGEALAYLSFNNSLVKTYPIQYYESGQLYPKLEQMPYPKVNEVIPVVNLYVWKKTLNKVLEIKPPREVSELKDRVLYFVLQHHTHTYYGFWLDPDNMVINYKSKDGYFAILPKYENDRYRYLHLAIVNTEPGKLSPIFLTNGQWEVTSISGYDSDREIVYFTATKLDVRKIQLYSLSIKQPRNKEPVCLSCHFVSLDCNTVSAKFSTSGKYYLLSCQGPTVPKLYLRSASTEKTLLVVENNTAYANYIQTKALPIVQYLTFPLKSGLDAFVKLVLPSTFENEKKSSPRALPLVLKVYAGPDTKAVTENWGITYETHLVTEKKYAVAYVDARGTSDRGSKYSEALYKHLGDYEIQDQIEITKALVNFSTILDPNNVAVWGWSYGGFATARIVERDSFQTFKCAIAVAPVTDLRFYDAAYTERYMGMDKPNDNELGYKKASALENVEKFRKGKFLLAHGTADDNVHMQNTALLVDELERLNIQFQFMMYTNQKHSISQRRKHLYTMMDKFLDDCFSDD